MTRVAIIGGTGLNSVEGVTTLEADRATPYGEASAALGVRSWHGHEAVFLARHGQPHRLAPHQINYRANLWLLKAQGVQFVLATNAVGGITGQFTPGTVALADQLIDYTWGRQHTYAGSDALRHVEFAEPYDTGLRSVLGNAAARCAVEVVPQATYGCTQGPRLETAAEIDRMERDGCDVVGMTGMPEAGLARELDLAYAAICLVVNAAAGRGAPIDEDEIGRLSREGMSVIVRLLDAFFELLD